MSDNGPQFASTEFKEFSGQYRFSQRTSSPHYVQANEFIECMVQTVKMSMEKCLASGHDFNLAMLVYRATPQSNKLPSPAEMLNNRKFRALLPVCKLLIKEKLYMARVHPNQPVYVQQDPKSLWKPAIATEIPSD